MDKNLYKETRSFYLKKHAFLLVTDRVVINYCKY